MKIFKVSRKTIFNWLTRWEDQRILGLYNQTERGRKAKFNSSQTKQVAPREDLRFQEWVKSAPKPLNIISNKIKKNCQVNVNKHTIKRIIKNS